MEQKEEFDFDINKYRREDKPLKQLPPKRQGLASIFNVQAPAVRLKSISNDSKMGMNFNNKMILPDDFKGMLAKSRRNLEEGNKPLIEIRSEAGGDSDID